jgi:hypothetical protein
MVIDRFAWQGLVIQLGYSAHAFTLTLSHLHYMMRYDQYSYFKQRDWEVIQGPAGQNVMKASCLTTAKDLQLKRLCNCYDFIIERKFIQLWRIALGWERRGLTWNALEKLHGAWKSHSFFPYFLACLNVRCSMNMQNGMNSTRRGKYVALYKRRLTA